MIELKRHVERIVHPIRAFESRKYRMREELFAHLAAAAEEAGVDEAIERLGPAEDVRHALQGSVPTWERLLCSPTPFSLERRFRAWSAPDSTHHAKRSLLITLQFFWFILFILLLALPMILIADEARVREAEHASRGLAVVLGFLCWYLVCIFALHYAAAKSGLARLVHPSTRLSPWLKAALSLIGDATLVLVLLAGCFSIATAMRPGEDVSGVVAAAITVIAQSLGWFWLALVPIVLYALFVHEKRIARRRYIDWECDARDTWREIH